MINVGKIAALSIFFAVAAHAAPESTTVPYGDLDLNKRAGAEAMLTRLKAGIDRICGEPGHLSLAQREQYRTCRKQAMNSAVAQLDAPLVSSLYGLPLSQVAMDK